MANNRMLIICNVCHPEQPAEFTYHGDNYHGVLPIAKWYPAAGGIGGDDGSYYTNYTDLKEWGGRFFEFLSKHQHQEVESEHYKAGAGQENPVRLEYESEGLPKIKEKE